MDHEGILRAYGGHTEAVVGQITCCRLTTYYLHHLHLGPAAEWSAEYAPARTAFGCGICNTWCAHGGVYNGCLHIRLCAYTVRIMAVCMYGAHWLRTYICRANLGLNPVVFT